MVDFNKRLKRNAGLFKTIVDEQAGNAALDEASQAGPLDPLDAILPPAEIPKEEIVLSPEQERVWEVVQAGRNVLVTGSAGTGKSTILRALIQRLGYGFHVTASTGIAAVNVSGSTVHSWAGLGKAEQSAEDLASDILSKQSYHYFRIKSATHLAIDEISMLPASVFELLDQVLRIVRRSDRPFGGLTMILFGDFLQLPPVQPEVDDVKFAFQSQTWRQANIETIMLSKVYRQADERFSTALNDLRRGFISERAKAVLAERYFPSVEKYHEADPEWKEKPPVIIHATNKEVDDENDKRLAELPEDPVALKSNDIGKGGPLLRLKKDCLAPEVLQLKVGARVMLLKNIDTGMGLANGSLGVVSSFLTREAGFGAWKHTLYLPVVRFDNGLEYTIQKAKFEIVEDGKVVACREQYPLRLAWAITAHKSQGMTLDKVQVFLGNIFEDGQAYVALSRARTLGGLFIMSRKPKCITAHRDAVRFYFGDEEPTEEPISDNSEPKARNNAETREGIVPAPSDGQCDSAATVLLPRDDREQVGHTQQVHPVPVVSTLLPDPDDIPMDHEGDYRRHVEEMIQAIEEADSRDGIAFAIRTFRKLHPKD